MKHAIDLGASGSAGHKGSDGSAPHQRIERECRWKGAVGENLDFGLKQSAMEVIKDFVVDDGVIDRNHRENIFSREYKKIGIAVEKHKEWGFCVV